MAVIPMNKGVSLPDEFVWQCLRWESEGDGQLFAEIFRQRFVHNAAGGKWLAYDGLVWEQDNLGRSLAAVSTVADEYEKLLPPLQEKYNDLAKDPDGNKSKLKKAEAILNKVKGQIKKLRNTTGRAACLEFARTLPEGSLAIDGLGLDPDPYLLATKNKIIDLASGQVRVPRQDYWITKRTPVEWLGLDTPCPTWEKFLAESFENQDKINFMRRWSGYCLTGDVSEQKFVQMSGDGRNGKGLYAEIMMEVLGDLAGPIQSEMLLDQGRNKSASGPTPEIVGLYGMRLAFASETDEHRRYSLARVKWLTGADTLKGRASHAPLEVTFKPTHKLVILTNNDPSADASDHAFWERINLIKMPYMFMEHPSQPHHKPRNIHLRKELEQELPGILAWCVRGALEWAAHGLQVPPIIRADTLAYRRREDMLKDWLDACCAVEKDDVLQPRISMVGNLYTNFCAWYQSNIGQKIPSGNWFGRQLRKKYPAKWHKDSSGRVAYRGLYLKA